MSDLDQALLYACAFCLAVLVIMLVVKIVRDRHERRRVDAWAADLGVARMPGESNGELLARGVRKLRGIGGGR